MEEGAKVHKITPFELSCPDRLFQSQRRKWADRKALKPYYIVADDDCLPPNVPFVKEGIDILERHPEFGILSLWPANATIHPWTPPQEEQSWLVGGKVHEDEEVMEHVSVGGIRICRKGLLQQWPEQTAVGYDSEHAAALRRAGYRVGYFKNIRMVHLGEGNSTVWI